MAQFDDNDQVRQLEAIGIIHKKVSSNPGLVAALTAADAPAITVAGLQPSHRIIATPQETLASANPGSLTLQAARCTTPGQLLLTYANAHATVAQDAPAHNVAILAFPGDLN